MVNNLRLYAPLAIIGILAFSLYAGTLSALISNFQFPMTSSINASNKNPTVNIILYMGEFNGKLYFGSSSMMSMSSSPGPTLRFSLSDIVNVTVINVGSEPHAFAITDAPATGATVLFNAEIGSSNNPIQPHQDGSVVFSPNNAGQTFFYISPLPGQAEAGMYGCVIISASPTSGSGTSEGSGNGSTNSGMSGMGM